MNKDKLSSSANDYVLLESYIDDSEASIVMSLLESNGIKAQIITPVTGEFDCHFPVYKIYVNSAQLSQAKKIIMPTKGET